MKGHIESFILLSYINAYTLSTRLARLRGQKITGPVIISERLERIYILSIAYATKSTAKFLLRCLIYFGHQTAVYLGNKFSLNFARCLAYCPVCTVNRMLESLYIRYMGSLSIIIRTYYSQKTRKG